MGSICQCFLAVCRYFYFLSCTLDGHFRCGSAWSTLGAVTLLDRSPGICRKSSAAHFACIFFEQFFQWRNRRREKKGAAGPTKRDKRSQQLWEKYGIPGLALLAPLLVGTDIAAVAAFSLGASRSRVLAWMTVSLAMWTIVFAAASAYGVSLLDFTQEVAVGFSSRSFTR